MRSLPAFEQVIETGIYVDDLEAAERFYCGVLRLRRIGGQVGRDLFLGVGRNVLLVFYAPETRCGKTLPSHGAQGSSHFALQVENVAALEQWKEHLLANDIPVEKEMDRGKPDLRSIYFRDPAGNLVEIIVRGVWPV